MLIGGKLVQGESSFSVINPSSGSAFAKAPACSKAQLEDSVRAAKEAQPKWAALAKQEFSAIMKSAAQKLSQKVDAIAELLVKEQGKPLAAAKEEALIVCGLFMLQSKAESEYERVLADTPKERVIERRVPLGVVAVIAPWNYPLILAFGRVAECLGTRNTVVLKPSPYTPLSALLVAEIISDVFPPGVLNVVCGGDDVGEWLVEHEDVAKVCFTGSVKSGKAVQAASSSTLKRTTLELGGNDAAVVLEDADPQKAAEGVFAKAMRNSGQVCIAVKRAYVHASQYEAFVNHLTMMAKGAHVGDGFEKGVHFGPINNKMQLERVKELVEDAKAQGAKVHAGGEPLKRDGFFYPPTILTGISEGVRIVDEEQFGPVLPVMPFTDIKDAVQRVNDTTFGLGNSVWSTNPEKAAEVAAQLRSGTVWINSHGDLTPDIPFGGWGQSGVGRVQGSSTVESNTNAQVIRIPKVQSKL